MFRFELVDEARASSLAPGGILDDDSAQAGDSNSAPAAPVSAPPGQPAASPVSFEANNLDDDEPKSDMDEGEGKEGDDDDEDISELNASSGSRRETFTPKLATGRYEKTQI